MIAHRIIYSLLVFGCGLMAADWYRDEMPASPLLMFHELNGTAIRLKHGTQAPGLESIEPIAPAPRPDFVREALQANVQHNRRG